MTNVYDENGTTQEPEEELEGTQTGDGLEPDESEEDLYSDFDPDFDPDFDEFGEELDPDEDDWHYEPPGPGLVETTQPVDPSDYCAIIHDSFGEKYVNVATLVERASSVTILRILGVLKLEPRGEVQYFLDGALVTADHVVNAGQTVYIVGKLAGGR